ncbi:MAG TPA: hypothetical protein VFW02_08105 [Candidatus Limnocylindrales bacterium]|nr:hypothetical protein [Candidatus Limnocylindrales bacterium]
MTVHVADPKRVVSLVLVVLLIVAMALVFAAMGSEPVPIGRS